MVKGLRSLTEFTGQKIQIQLKHGGKFNVYVCKATEDHMDCLDENGVDLHIEQHDVAFIIG